MKIARTIAVNICRVLVALTFILSGYVKAVDPLGTQYKIEDYLQAIPLPLLHHIPSLFTLLATIVLFTLEFCLGIMLLLAVKKQLVAWLVMLFMAVMTIVTIWLVIADPVSDCGCFGDALHLSNTQTLIKNIILLILSVAILIWHNDMLRFISDGNSTIVFSYSIFFIIGTAIYCLYYLPIFDFRPYHIGVNIPQAMQIPPGAQPSIYETTFIMQKDGTTREFDLDHYPDSSWTFVNSHTRVIHKGYEPPIHDFTIQTADGDDMTDSILKNPGYTFLLISPSLNRADSSNFGPIDQLHEYAQDYGYPFYCLTASDSQAISHWQDITGADYPFFFTDATTLKTIIRSNPGLLLLHNGTIIQKWSNNDLPKEEHLTSALPDLSIGSQHDNNVTKKITRILLVFILPIILLSVADRLWAHYQRKKKKEPSPTPQPQK